MKCRNMQEKYLPRSDKYSIVIARRAAQRYIVAPSEFVPPLLLRPWRRPLLPTASPARRSSSHQSLQTAQ
ncbi:hypothetical protein J6590_054101 [Homalodisca vitripennis]|nr:hypothetical protein J6590_054101 [Homalodisca vitripennis]